MRTMQDSYAPLYPVPKHSANEVPLPPPASGTHAPLFHCHCAPKCIEFVKPRDHPELRWVGAVNQPLRSHIVASGPSLGPNSRPTHTKFADFSVDSKVAYEFNDRGFYEEMLAGLEANYNALLVANVRAQQWLHATKEKTPARDPQALAYVPYYPSQHLASRGQAFVARAPLANAEDVAAMIAAPTVGGVVSSSSSSSVHAAEHEEKDESNEHHDRRHQPQHLPHHLQRGVRWSSEVDLTSPPLPVSPVRLSPPTAPAVAAMHAQVDGSSMQPEPSAPPPPSTEAFPAASAPSPTVDAAPSVSASVLSARARLAQERASFAAQMREQLRASMSIPAAQQ